MGDRRTSTGPGTGTDPGLREAARSDTGHRRTRNEDGYLDDLDRRLFAVADGLGGHPAGDVASRTALDAIDEHLDENELARTDDGRMRLLSRALIRAHRRVVEAAQAEPGRVGMGTTAVVAHVDDDLLTLAHIGDSRAYVLQDGELRRITEDHVHRGPFGRTLAQALGIAEQVEPEAAEVDLRPGDRVLLCTDGLTDMVDDGEIARILGSGHDPATTCDELVTTALANGGLDNVTVVVIDCPPPE